jgi:putative phosphonate metabolism protein
VEACVSLSVRIAIYYAPAASSALWRHGVEWLGRDPESGQEFAAPALDGIGEQEWREIVRFPRGYGFHATLKPPFTPRPDVSPAEAIAAARRFAERRARFPLPPLRVSRLGGFVALTTVEPCEHLHMLADDCVREFDSLRQPATAEELASRRQGISNPRQLELIGRWGYPYVFEEWKFHMTLTSNLGGGGRADVVARMLQDWFAPALAMPLEVDSVCVFVQAGREAPFRLIERIPFGE